MVLRKSRETRIDGMDNRFADLHRDRVGSREREPRGTGTMITRASRSGRQGLDPAPAPT